MASLSLGHTALSCMLRSRAVGALGKLQGDGVYLDPFPPPSLSGEAREGSQPSSGALESH